MASRSLRILAVVAVGLSGVACGGGGSSTSSTLGPAARFGQITVDGVVRTYRVFAPPTVVPGTPVPLVVVLHGGADTVNDAVSTTGFDQVATAHNVVVAYPQGTREEWNAGFCCGSAPGRGIDDVGFLDQLLDRLESTYPIDHRRVYLTGVSNGAMMAYDFACQHPDRVTAVASVAGSIDPTACHPASPVSVLELHGTADPLVPFGGGSAMVDGGTTFDYPSSQAVAADWAQVDQCPITPTVSMSGPVTTTAWGTCAQGTTVTLMAVSGGGHVWFANGLGPADGSVDATSTIWGFFSPLRSP